MLLPSTIELIASCEGADDLSGLIFQMRVEAGTKNPYHILFPKTSAAGIASITADDFRGQFEDHWEVGLMDYNGSIESAAQSVQLSLFDLRPLRERRDLFLAWSLLKHERLRWGSQEEKLDYLLSCRNEMFRFEPTNVLIGSGKPIGAELIRRSRSV